MLRRLLGRSRRSGACVGALVLMALTLLLFAGASSEAAYAAQSRNEASEQIPGAALWRDVRQGVSGITNSPDAEHGNLINSSGEDWRQTRNGPVAAFGRWALALAALGIGLLFLIRGRIRVDNGFSGKTIERWTAPDRVIHWFVAILFVVLALTGLSFLYGKELLLPIMDKASFAAWGALAKTLHNYGGPLFVAGLVLMIVKWLPHNRFKKIDAVWLAKGGGILTKAHPSAEYLNAGEKLWFWLVVFGGLGVSISGLILDFPNFGQTRGTMQLTHILHTLFALTLMAVFLGHVYIATLGTEGALEGMVYGHVDVEWAKQHHDLWYQEVVEGKGAAAEKIPDISPSDKPATL